MAALTVLSALPPNAPLITAFEFSDKLKHFIAYFVLGLTFCLWFTAKKWLAKPVVWGTTVVVICTVFGMINEFHQSFIPGRDGNDLGDLTANAIGALFSPFLYYLVIRIRSANTGFGHTGQYRR